MPEKPLISFITVNLNDVEGLKRTMFSIFGQIWQKFEYIVIDGGSIDGSREFIESHSNKIDYWVSEKDSGIYNAMNKGIKAANGEYLLFLNSGDHLFGNQVLSKNIHELGFFDLVYFNIQIINKNNVHIISYPSHLRFTDLFYGTLCHQCVFIKKTLFAEISLYDENLKIVSDWKFLILALFKFNCSYKKVDNLLSTYYSDGISADNQNEQIIMEERQRVLKKYFENFFYEMDELNELRSTIKNLKGSKKINLLIKFGLLNKF
ncbi:glycosyltransferase involved in cell wall biosynthesis [Gillisia sp. Hel_I_86]|uniref:glycosyltransferase family 2 protein n=1 Tax=Gillisia sp. Hel_I_86 TaxID=1249981 RepID=UPI00119954BF|nr:glycosyltransferase family 2 protein [Gillisia sp. Hel_I_86]TVZ25579.1 glycosyltransferase involved in cell wall biosynthesis [Gillisia sp. Hel_I_86]